MIAPAPASGAAVTAGSRPPAVAASSLRAAVRALGVPWWLTAAAPSSTTAGAGLGDEPGAGSVKPPAVVSVATPLDPDDPNDRETVKHICCAMANVSPHAAVVADGFGWPLGSGPEFEQLELVRPGQPVTP